MKVIDLTLPIIPHWRYGFTTEPGNQMSKGDGLNTTKFCLGSHNYTHIDSPRHFLEDGKTLNDFPLELLIGEALILDVSHVKANTEITAEDLAKAAHGHKIPNMVLIKTSWDARCSWMTTEFWDTAPYIGVEGAKYLQTLGFKVIGYDFPQDYDIRKLRFIPAKETYQPTHEFLLKKDILMIEYICNLHKIDTPIVNIVALPLNLQEADGAQIRIVAVLD